MAFSATEVSKLVQDRGGGRLSRKVEKAQNVREGRYRLLASVPKKLGF